MRFLFTRQGFKTREVFLKPLAFRRLERIQRQFCVYVVFTLRNAR